MHTGGIWESKWFYPKPRVAVHAHYRFGFASPLDHDHLHNLDILILRGICQSNLDFVYASNVSDGSMNDDFVFNNRSMCTRYLGDTMYFVDMHMFEDANYAEVTNTSQLISAHKIRLARFQGCSLPEDNRLSILKHFRAKNFTETKFLKLIDDISNAPI